MYGNGETLNSRVASHKSLGVGFRQLANKRQQQHAEEARKKRKEVLSRLRTPLEQCSTQMRKIPELTNSTSHQSAFQKEDDGQVEGTPFRTSNSHFSFKLSSPKEGCDEFVQESLCGLRKGDQNARYALLRLLQALQVEYEEPHHNVGQVFSNSLTQHPQFLSDILRNIDMRSIFKCTLCLQLLLYVDCRESEQLGSDEGNQRCYFAPVIFTCSPLLEAQWEDIQELAALVIGTFCSQQESLCTEAISSGCLPLLAKLLSHSDEGMRQTAIWSIQQLCTSSSARSCGAFQAADVTSAIICRAEKNKQRSPSVDTPVILEPSTSSLLADVILLQLGAAKQVLKSPVTGYLLSTATMVSSLRCLASCAACCKCAEVILGDPNIWMALQTHIQAGGPRRLLSLWLLYNCMETKLLSMQIGGFLSSVGLVVDLPGGEGEAPASDADAVLCSEDYLLNEMRHRLASEFGTKANVQNG